MKPAPIDVSPNALRLFAARNTRKGTPIRALIHAAADRIEELARRVELLSKAVHSDVEYNKNFFDIQKITHPEG